MSSLSTYHKLFLSLLILNTNGCINIAANVIASDNTQERQTYNYNNDRNPKLEIPNHEGTLIFFRGKSLNGQNPISADRYSCGEQGGELAIVNTRAKQEVAVNMVDYHHAHYCSFTFGLHRDGNQFRWENGVALGKPRFWAPGEPKNSLIADCVYMTRCERETGLNRWHTKACNELYRLQICQWDKRNPPSSSFERTTTSTATITTNLWNTRPTEKDRDKYETTAGNMTYNSYNSTVDIDNGIEVSDIVTLFKNIPIKLLARTGGAVVLLILLCAVVSCLGKRTRIKAYKPVVDDRSLEQIDCESTTVRTTSLRASLDDTE